MRSHFLLFSASALLAACSLGEAEGGGSGNGDGPGSDVVDTTINKQVCGVEVAVSGTFQRSQEPPADSDPLNCWPVGTWTFTATATSEAPPNGVARCPTAQFETQYRFSVTRNMDENSPDEGLDSYQLVSPANWEKVKIKVSSGGGGLCTGGVEFYSADGKTLTNLRPSIQTDNATLQGAGEYQVFEKDQWVPHE